MVFERCFENNPGEKMVSRISGDGGYRFWLQDDHIRYYETK